MLHVRFSSRQAASIILKTLTLFSEKKVAEGQKTRNRRCRIEFLFFLYFVRTKSYPPQIRAELTLSMINHTKDPCASLIRRRLPYFLIIKIKINGNM